MITNEDLELKISRNASNIYILKKRLDNLIARLDMDETYSVEHFAAPPKEVVTETRTQTLGGDILVRIDYSDGTWYDFFESEAESIQPLRYESKSEKITQLSKKEYHVPGSEVNSASYLTNVLLNAIKEDGSGIWSTLWVTSLVQKKRLGIAFVRYVVFMTDFGRIYFPKEYRNWFGRHDFFEPYSGVFPEFQGGENDYNYQHAVETMKYLNDLIKVKAKEPMEFNADADKAYTTLLTHILKSGRFSSMAIWKKELGTIAKQVLEKGTWFTTVM